MEIISCRTCKYCINKKCISDMISCLYGYGGEKSWDKSLYEKGHDFSYNFWESHFFSEKEFII